jgi:alcohol dehydrogenase class IV
MAAIARALGVASADTPVEDTARKAPEAVAAMCKDLGIPTGFGGLGLKESDIPALSEVGLGNIGPNPRGATLEEVVALFRKVL